MKIFVLLSAVLAVALAQANPKAYERPYTTPVPILKQIDKHNEDGSYSYGYENADGTYKIETKYQTGEVFGKYGYIDDTGSLREVEYGASQRGFEPAGTGVTVPPPTLAQNPDSIRALGPDEEDDGQYREDPAIYYNKDPNNLPSQPSYTSYAHSSINNYTPTTYTQPAYTAPARPAYTPPAPVRPTYTPSFAPTYNNPPAYTPPAPQYNDYYNNRVNNPAPTPAPQYNYAPQRSYWNPAPPSYPNYNMFQGHPAQNVDIWTGSYTVNYRR